MFIHVFVLFVFETHTHTKNPTDVLFDLELKGIIVVDKLISVQLWGSRWQRFSSGQKCKKRKHWNKLADKTLLKASGKYKGQHSSWEERGFVKAPINHQLYWFVIFQTNPFLRFELKIYFYLTVILDM